MKPLLIRKEIDAHIADRLIEAIWRESLWLVHDDIATTDEVDDAIRYAMGLRYALMGVFEHMRLAGGEEGMRHFLSHFGPCLKWPWTKLMDVPDLTDDFIEKIKSGEINFEKLICTPSMMLKLSKLGKVLGPKGLMPNPKLGTVSENVKKAVTDAKSGQIELRNDKDGNIGVSIGKKSFSDEKLISNYKTIIDVLEKEKSNINIKGDLIKAAFITSTMGVSYKLKLDKVI